MKSYIKFLLILSISLTGCHFLEVERLGKSDIPNFFTDMDGLRSARVGMYYKLYNYHDGDYLKYSEVAGDMINFPQSMSTHRRQFDFESLPEDNSGFLETIWKNGYDALTNVNSVLQYAPGLKEEYPSSSVEIDLIMAEALFCRAIFHLYMCNTYGQPYNYTADASHLGVVPVRRLLDVNENVIRSSVKETYRLITEDLLEAIRLFQLHNENSIDEYYVSRAACEALLARVYLYMEDWDNAISYATRAMQGKSLAKGDDYLAIYTEHGLGSKQEVIFRLTGFRHSSSLRKFYSEGDNTILLSAKYLQSFYFADDIRKKLIKNNDSSLKYAYNEEDRNSSKPDEEKFYAPIVLRVSELYLLRAEAYCRLDKLSEATADLKEIVARSQQKNVSEISLSYSNADALMKLIQRERILELSYEGHRLFDIIRWKQNLERDSETTSKVKILTYPSDLFVLPLSKAEIEANGVIQQNPGY